MSILDSLKQAIGSKDEDTRGLTFDAGDTFEFKISEEKDVKITSNIDKLSDVDVKYPLIKPFAYAHIKWDEENKEIMYRIEEPNLTEEDQELFDKITENLSEKLDVSLSSVQEREKVIEYLEGKINEVLLELGIKLSKDQHNKIMYYIYRDFVGLGKIEPFMHDPYIEDLGCDGTGIPVFAVHSEFGSVKSNVKFEKEELKNLVVKLAERCGRYVSYANPLLDGALPDGSRVNASLTEDVTSKGPTFSIRKFQETPFSSINMINLGTSSPKIMAYMWLLMQYQQSVLICGGTATGKTSFLNSVVSFIPPEDKIVSIEDTRELRLPHENWIPSVTRSMFGQHGEADVDMDQLLKESFRENPDYVVVGEVRGEEASVLFQGMASGHPSMGTMHASGPNDVVKRLVTPPISLSPALVESLDAIVVMTHAKGVEKSARRVRGVHEVQKVMEDSQSARTNKAFTWTARDDSHSMNGEPFLFDQISTDFGISKDELHDELETRTKVLNWLKEKGVTDFHEVSKVIAEYYKDKEQVLKMVESEERDYTLEDIIEAEESVDITHDDQLDNAMDRDRQEQQQKLKNKDRGRKLQTEAEKKEENTEAEPEDDQALEKEMAQKEAGKKSEGQRKQESGQKQQNKQEKEPEQEKFSGDEPIEKKKATEKNPVSDLEKKLRAERKKVENLQDRTEDMDENPFEDSSKKKVEENPFEA
ncbi:MAG: ATPase, T2SS/T4P/T4SS family [Candidatus Nanohaloarchaea archaeon]